MGRNNKKSKKVQNTLLINKTLSRNNLIKENPVLNKNMAVANQDLNNGGGEKCLAAAKNVLKENYPPVKDNSVVKEKIMAAAEKNKPILKEKNKAAAKPYQKRLQTGGQSKRRRANQRQKKQVSFSISLLIINYQRKFLNFI